MVRPYTVEQPFRFWCQKILPLVYDDSLSYYELLNKVVDYLNKNVDNVNALGEAFNNLQAYVQNYFTNLDVQQEIDAKLDEMVQDGTLNELILPLVGDAVSDWLEENVTPTGSAVLVDSTLTISGAAADAKVTGDEISDLKSEINDENKNTIPLMSTIDALISPTFYQGLYEYGQEADSVKRIRSYIGYYAKGTVFNIVCNSQYIKIDTYSNPIRSGVQSTTSTSGWIGGNATLTYTTPVSGYVTFLVANANNYSDSSAIAPTDYNMIITANTEIGVKVYDNSSVVEQITEFVVVNSVLDVITASINAQTGVISNNANCRTIYIPCLPNTLYKVAKKAGQRFVVGCSSVLPASGTTLTKALGDNTSSEIEFTTDDTAKYLCAFVYYSTTDTEITAADMVASVLIYISSCVPANQFEFAFSDDSRSIHNNRSIPFYKNKKTLAGSVPYTIQSVIYDNPNWVVFSSETDAVLKVNPHGRISYNLTPDFGHVMSAERLSDGSYVVASADANYGTTNEKRFVYFYDLETNTITDRFEPNIDGSLVFASKIDEETYYLISNITASNDLHFFLYNTTTSTATEVGSKTIERAYLQGGCRVNNLLYLSINDGWNGERDSIVTIIDMNTLETIDNIVLHGFVEVEGFDVQCDVDGSVFAYFGDAKNYSLYCAKLL